uniref:G protein-coupled receptor 156 n=1 Tax=Scleropages formosus TaxID=113540 RepID=A0A8C9VEL8_SCLFO
MEPGLNCSVECGSRGCLLDPWISSREAWGPLQHLCALATGNLETPPRPLSPVLRAITWTLLSSGILLALLFLAFTLRCRNNRIVKMSSPNLNILTICGSILTYSSGFLFGIEDKALLPGSGPKIVLQARIWTLCIGISLVFGPILGKTWRLYRVFTQRVPDKRVIIRDIQLIGLVALLILADIVVLTTWSLTDPVQCIKSIRAAVVEHDVSYSLLQHESCSSLYTDIWIAFLSALKGSVLLYGTYLAGLTSNVSWPPVNQSLTIMAPVCLVTLSVALSIPVSRLLYSWPNVVYSVISGSIFICTLTTNCLLFVPQLTQWKQFEDESNPSSSQMAKFFSSPSKSLQSMYSEDEIFYLRGENDSMKRLLMEKNAVIDSLQEQVNSAKDKLLKLMSASSSLEHQEVGTSSTNLNSSFMQKVGQQPDPSAHLLETVSTCSPFPPSSPSLTAERDRQSAHSHVSQDSEYIDRKSGFRLDDENYKSDTEEMECNVQTAPDSTQLSVSGEALMDVTLRGAGGCPPDNPTDLLPQVTTGISPSVQVTATLGGKCNFVSSEKLQEIILDLSVDAVSLRSPKWEEEHSSASLEEPSPKLSYRFYYPSISPYVMRRRRPPFRATRAGLPAYCYSLSLPHTGCKGAGDSKAEPDAIVSQPQQHNCCREQVAAATPAKLDHRGAPRRCTVTPFSGCDSRSSPIRRKCLLEGWKPEGDMYYYSDSESSSSDDDYCFYHRPYCNACSHGQYESMESTSSETSDSELGPLKNYRHVTHPVVNFKEDLKPTFV